MTKRWIINPPDSALQKRLIDELGVTSVIAQLLVNRDITSPRQASEFLDCSLSRLHDPLGLKDMKKSVARIKKALSRGDKILVYGDYDVDGITSVALLSTVLKGLGGNVIEYIPNRLEEGYGLNLGAARFAYQKKVKLIITVDCGISAFKEIDYLNSLGIDTIITDHHEPPEDCLPRAHSVVNPLQEGCSYPFKYLAGVGLAFKLIQALLDKDALGLQHYLDLVALGTISDVVPMLGENRILTKYGLSHISKSRNLGIRELIKVSGLSGREIGSEQVGFILGPRINASGRIGSPKLAFRLLTTGDSREAKELAGILNQENRNRQKIQNKVYEEALDKVSKEINFKDHRVIVLSGDNWHSGVIGIVASRLVDKFYRPTVMISVAKNLGKGSARSIEGLHLFEVMSQCKSHLDSFGGHKGACGLTILRKNIDKFRTHINKLAHDLISPDDLLPSLKVDMKIPLNKLSMRLISQIDKLSPYGAGNPQPVFASENVTVKHGPILVGRRGLKLWVTDEKVTCEALVFGSNDYLDGVSKKSIISLAYKPLINRWGGLDSIQLNLEDARRVG